MEHTEKTDKSCGSAAMTGYAYELGDKVKIIDSIDGDSFVVDHRYIKNQCVKIDGVEQVVSTYMYAPINSYGFYPEQCLSLCGA